MEQFDINKILRSSVILRAYSGEKTLSLKAIKTAFHILYMNHPLEKQGIQNAYKYNNEYATNGHKKINSFGQINEQVRYFLDNDAFELCGCQLKINNSSIGYLCGLVDTFNNNAQQF